MRDVKPHTLKRLAMEGENEFDAWFKRTEGMEWVKDSTGMNHQKPIELKSLWRYAFSRGVTVILRRVDALKENT